MLAIAAAIVQVNPDWTTLKTKWLYREGIRSIASPYCAVTLRDGACNLLCEAFEYFMGVTLNPVVLEQSILADMPDRRPGHVDRRLARLRTHDPVVLAGDTPPRCHAVTRLVLERLNDMKFKVGDFAQECSDPFLELFTSLNLHAARRYDEILSDQTIDCVEVLLLPYLVPKIFNDLNRTQLLHFPNLRLSKNVRTPRLTKSRARPTLMNPPAWSSWPSTLLEVRQAPTG
jgi:hypothetical protein